MFAPNTDYIFYALTVLQPLTMNSQINTALKKVCPDQITTNILTNKFSQTIRLFLTKDDAYQFIGRIKGTTASWKKFLHEVRAMVKHLG